MAKFGFEDLLIPKVRAAVQRGKEEERLAEEWGPDPRQQQRKGMWGAAQDAQNNPALQRKLALAQRNLALTNQATQQFQAKQRAEQLAKAKGQVWVDEKQEPEQTTTIKQKAGGDVSIKQQNVEPDGTKVTREKTGNRFEQALKQMIKPEPTPEELAYRDRLREAANMKAPVNLQPIAQFVDTLTGSRMAPGFQDAYAAQQRQMADRLRASKALADEARRPAATAYSRLMKEREFDLKRRGIEARELGAKAQMQKALKGKDPKYLNIVRRAASQFAEKLSEGGLVRDALLLSGNKDKVTKGVSKDTMLKQAGLNLPSYYDKPVEAIMITANPGDITQAKLSILEGMVNEARALKNEDGGRMFTDEDIEKDVQNMIIDIDLKLGRLAALYGRQ